MATIKEHCGIFGIFGHPHAAELTYLGLYALQHRGQESAGIASTNGERIIEHKGMGLVDDVFDTAVLRQLDSPTAIGHIRYSTTGTSNVANAQPILVQFRGEQVALGHNGNLVNASQMRKTLESKGHIFQSTTDSEIFLHLIAERGGEFRDGLLYALERVRGAYSLVFLTRNQVVGVRDPHGFRPLWLGKLENSYVLASETCALDLIHAEYVREVEPGEIVYLDENGVTSERFAEPKPSYCIFELIYFARADSIVFGDSVYEVRKKLGAKLAQEHPVEADMVTSVPDSANAAALGYHQESGVPLELGFIRNPYVGRSFIMPLRAVRRQVVDIKLNPVRSRVSGKRIVVVDDSIIRGTTTKEKVVNSLRRAGAKEIHLRVSCPPHRHGCCYGIDFPDPKQLIAHSQSVKQIQDYLQVDSLGYLSIEGMLGCPSSSPQHYCTACFSAEYPVEPKELTDKYRMELLRPVTDRLK